MSKRRQQTLYIFHNNRGDEPIATVTNVIINRNTIGGTPIGDTYELQGSVFNKSRLRNAFQSGQLVTFTSGPIMIEGRLENLMFVKDKRYKTKRHFQTELRPIFDSRNPAASGYPKWKYPHSPDALRP